MVLQCRVTLNFEDSNILSTFSVVFVSSYFIPNLILLLLIRYVVLLINQ